MKILDVGCGNNKAKDAIGIDKSPDTQADIVHDLNKFPYPFNENEFDQVICWDVLEHLDDVMAVMEEIHRISKPNAEIRIRVPHFSSSNAYTDLTHKHFFGVRAFEYFTDDFPRYKHYTKIRFKTVQIKISFISIFHRIFKVGFFANRNPLRWERSFAFIFPAENIEFRLLVSK